MKEINLTKGLNAIVDDADFDFLIKFKWCASGGHKTDYAVRGKNGRIIQMHRLIMGDPPFLRAQVDHIDGNGLNNQRHNLRWCTKAQNRRNEPKRKGYSNKFKGVSFDPRREKFRCYIKIAGKQQWLGYFSSEVEAAR